MWVCGFMSELHLSLHIWASACLPLFPHAAPSVSMPVCVFVLINMCVYTRMCVCMSVYERIRVCRSVCPCACLHMPLPFGLPVCCYVCCSVSGCACASLFLCVYVFLSVCPPAVPSFPMCVCVHLLYARATYSTESCCAVACRAVLCLAPL